MSENSLENAVMEELKCPICANFMNSPIRQCVKGHTICDQCYHKVKICPHCRGPKGQARCFPLEKILAKLRMPCRYSKFGCEFTSLGESIKEHEKFCKFGPRHCPFRHYENCQWKDLSNKLVPHLIKKHNENTYFKPRNMLLCSNFLSIDSYIYFYVVIHVFDEFFRLTWDVNPETNMVRWTVYFMGKPELAASYMYGLDFYKESNQVDVKITWKAPCCGLPDTDEKFADNNCLYLHRDMLRSMSDSRGQLAYKIKIYDMNQLEKALVEATSNMSVVSTLIMD